MRTQHTYPIPIARGADVNLVTKWGPPIINAAWNGDAAILKLLLAKGADPNGNYKTETALHLAAQKGQLECTIILVEAGADVNALTKFREPPIHFAKKGGHEDVAATGRRQNRPHRILANAQ